MILFPDPAFERRGGRRLGEGVVQPSFDKQFVRNWLTGPQSGWDRHGSAAPPPLPDDIVTATRERYIDSYERISGLKFADWIGR